MGKAAAKDEVSSIDGDWRVLVTRLSDNFVRNLTYAGLQALIVATPHTHALSSITQSGAAIGDNPRWNGSAWVPATPALPVWGAISGVLADQADLVAVLNAKLSSTIPGVGTEFQFRAGANSLGAVTGSSFAGGVVTLPTLAVTDLTSGRVPFSGAAGRLQDSATLTFDGSGSLTLQAYRLDNTTHNNSLILGTPGNGAPALFAFSSDGGTNRFKLASGNPIAWSSTTNAYSGTPDTGLHRNAAGVVEINNGTGGTLRDLRLRAAYGGDASGLNQIASNLTIAPGLSTGNAAPANVVIQGTVAGSSGSAAQTPSDHLTVGNNKVVMNVPTLDFNNNGNAVIQFGNSYGYITTNGSGVLEIRSNQLPNSGFLIGNGQGGPQGVGGIMMHGPLHATYMTDLTITSGGTYADSQTAGNLHLRGGQNYAGGTNAHGGKIYLYGGAGSGTGTTGDTYLCFNGTAAVGNVQIGDGAHLVVGTGTGLKIGTATGQKLGFWNVTPVVQQVLATGAGATVDNVISLLQTLGLCKQS